MSRQPLSNVPLSQIDILDTQQRVDALTVAKLKDIARALGLAISGRKADLQGRIKMFFTNGVRSNDAVRLLTVRTLVLKAVNDQPIPNYQALYASIQNNSYQVDVPNQYSNHAPRAQESHQGPKPWVYFNESPFYKIKRLIQGSPMYARKALNERGSCEMTFILNSPETEVLAGGPQYRLFLLSGAYHGKPGLPSHIEFPHPIEVSINREMLTDNLKGIKNKPGTSRPADLTKYLKKAPHVNHLKIVYAFSKVDYLFFCYLVEKLSPEKVLQDIMNAPRIAKMSTLKVIQREQDEEDDLVEMQEIITLRCPLTYGRMKYPSKSMFCKHVQCFDALSFLQLQEQAPTWSCPICQREITVKTLAIDDYMSEVIAATGDDDEAIEIEHDGSWRVKKDDEKEKQGELHTTATKVKEALDVEESFVKNEEKERLLPVTKSVAAAAAPADIEVISLSSESETEAEGPGEGNDNAAPTAQSDQIMDDFEELERAVETGLNSPRNTSNDLDFMDDDSLFGYVGSPVDQTSSHKQASEAEAPAQSGSGNNSSQAAVHVLEPAPPLPPPLTPPPPESSSTSPLTSLGTNSVTAAQEGASSTVETEDPSPFSTNTAAPEAPATTAQPVEPMTQHGNAATSTSPNASATSWQNETGHDALSSKISEQNLKTNTHLEVFEHPISAPVPVRVPPTTSTNGVVATASKVAPMQGHPNGIDISTIPSAGMLKFPDSLIPPPEKEAAVGTTPKTGIDNTEPSKVKNYELLSPLERPVVSDARFPAGAHQSQVNNPFSRLYHSNSVSRNHTDDNSIRSPVVPLANTSAPSVRYSPSRFEKSGATQTSGSISMNSFLRGQAPQAHPQQYASQVQRVSPALQRAQTVVPSNNNNTSIFNSRQRTQSTSSARYSNLGFSIEGDLFPAMGAIAETSFAETLASPSSSFNTNGISGTPISQTRSPSRFVAPQPASNAQTQIQSQSQSQSQSQQQQLHRQPHPHQQQGQQRTTHVPNGTQVPPVASRVTPTKRPYEVVNLLSDDDDEEEDIPLSKRNV